MLTWFFIFCAVVGGTVLVCQFVLTVLGLSGDHGLDTGHDFGGHDGDAAGAHGADNDGHDAAGQHGSSWLFAMISFRTLVAAAAFFGLVGLAAESAEQSVGIQLLLGLLAGLGAMYGVHSLVRSMGKLGEDGTQKVQAALGQEGTVYVPIPPAKSQAGKIQLKLQNRLVEYEAITNNAERLATGTRVRVIAVAGNRLEVEPLAAVRV